jgi:tight adherence protein B
VLTAPAKRTGGGGVVAVLGRRRASRGEPAASVDRVAAATERLAALLTAGLAPAAAWRNVVPHGDHGPDGWGDPRTADARVVQAAADAAGDGGSVAEAIERARAAHAEASPAWSMLAAAWAVADAAGAPLAGCLAVLADALRSEAQLRREAAAALAGPAASARLVAALPVIAVAFGALLGFDTIGVLVGNPIGLSCLVAGSALLWAGARWSRSLVARASVARPAAGLELELLAVALTSGASLARAQELVDGALRVHVPDVPSSGAAAAVLRLAEQAGAPVAELLRAEAARLRGAARAEGAVRAAALGVRLMIPLGCCVLPAFVLLGVAPLMISVVTGTLGGAV